jgi:glycosyltransferase involved in cell wall biosynthesis
LGIAPILQKSNEDNDWRFIQEKVAKPDPVFPKIIFDGVFFQKYQTGIARLWRNLLEEWVKDGFAKYLLVLDRMGTAPAIPGINYRMIPPYDENNLEADSHLLQQVCNEEQAQLFISSYYTTPLDTPSVFMAYDMIPEVMGADLNQPMWRQKHEGIQHASAYISISANTARDLVKYFPEVDLESVTVAHCGVQDIFTPPTPAEINQFKFKYGIAKPYFMVMGGGGYKNPELLYQALAKLPTRQGFEVVATGAGGLLAPELRELIPGVVVHRLQLSDSELRLAYGGAVALVYPSKYEGFGLPVLEAMSCGTPVITSPNASIPEVGAEAVIYLHDQDVDGLVEALCEVQKPKVRESLISKGLQQAEQFSWAKMAQKVKDALIGATLISLNLRATNLLVFPDWSQSEEDLYEQFRTMLEKIATHPEQMTLLIDTKGISFEDANLLLSSLIMNLLMEEDLGVDEELQISLVPELSSLQWDYLLTRVQDASL